MKKLASLLLLALAIAIPAHARGKKPASTAPGKYREWGPDIDELEILKTFRFADYSKIVVEPFNTSDVQLPDKDDNTYAPVKAVLASPADDFVQGLRGKVEAKVTIEEKPGTATGSDTLIIRVKVLECDPGSRAARYWASFGAGAAKIRIEGEIVDAQSGAVLARFTQERRSGFGVGGGGYQDLLQRDLRAIGEDVSNILKAF